MQDKASISVNVFNKRANDYMQKFMDVTAYKKSLDIFLQELALTAKLLEHACGPGNITRYMLNQKPQLAITAIDLAPNMIELAKANNPEATCLVMDGRHANQLNQTYNGIMAGFYLPYLSKQECLMFIHDAAQQLHSGGVLYFSTMEDSYSKSGLQTTNNGEEFYIYYHEATYLKEALHQNGFTLLLEEHLALPVSNNTANVDLILVAKKQ